MGLPSGLEAHGLRSYGLEAAPEGLRISDLCKITRFAFYRLDFAEGSQLDV